MSNSVTCLSEKIYLVSVNFLPGDVNKFHKCSQKNSSHFIRHSLERQHNSNMRKRPHRYHEKTTKCPFRENK